MLFSILAALFKAIPGSLGSFLQGWLSAYANANTQAMKDRQEAQAIADDEARMAELERRAAAGDKSAQDEIRKRESEWF